MHGSVPGSQSRVVAAVHHGVPAWAQWGAWKAFSGGKLGPPWRGVARDAALDSDTRPRPPASSAWCSWWCWGPRSGSGMWPFLFWSSSLSNSFFLGCGSALLLPACPVACSCAGAGGWLGGGGGGLLEKDLWLGLDLEGNTMWTSWRSYIVLVVVLHLVPLALYNISHGTHIWVIRTRTGKKLDKCHFFFKSQRLLRTEKSKNSYTFKSYYLILASRVLKIWVSGFRRNLGCARYAQIWVFFQNFKSYKQNSFGCFLTKVRISIFLIR